MTSPADLVQERYQNYWEVRAKKEDRPGWAEKPPLTLASASAGQDLWPVALQRYKNLLLTRGNLAKRPSAYWGNHNYPVQKADRSTSTMLQVMWITHFGDTPIYEISLRWGYTFDGQYIGSQGLTLYNGSTILRSVSLTAYAETGYDGHHFKERSAHPQDIGWFTDVLQDHWPIVSLDGDDGHEQLPQY